MTAPVEAGTALPTRTFAIDRARLVRYAGASGDFNPIHWDERFAESVGLPSVIAHGMLTMGTALRAVTDWLGDPGAVLDYGVRFTRPIPVPPTGSVDLAVAATVLSVDAEAGTAVLDVKASVDGQTVMARARVTVRIRENT